MISGPFLPKFTFAFAALFSIIQYDQAIRSLKAENADLKQGLKEATTDDMKRRLAEAQLKSDYLDLERTLQKIPPEIVFRYSGKNIKQERGE